MASIPPEDLPRPGESPTPNGSGGVPPRRSGIGIPELKLAGIGIIAVLAGLFVGENVGRVTIHFVFFTAKVRLIWVFLLCIGIGILLDRLVVHRGFPRRRKGGSR